MRIAMIGGGYVGLVSGACFAEFGVHVAIVETNPQRLHALRNGEIPIYEPGLDALVASNTQAGRLTFGDDIAHAVTGADAVFIAVGTPPRNGDGAADLQYVHAAARQIAHALTGYTVVVTKSTVPVGTSRRIAAIIRETRPDADFDVASNPEFLREGNAIGDFMRPDRVIIGLDQEKTRTDGRAEAVLRNVYNKISHTGATLLFTGIETAELTKYASNSFLAMKISFINEMADLCEKLGASVEDLADGMGLDRRIGREFLNPGPGYGGSCFPKDTLALSRIAQEAQSACRLVETTVLVNEARKAGIAGRIAALCGGSVSGKTIAVLGLTFKPETDDMRESPSLPVLHRLAEAGAVIRAYDPVAMNVARPLLPAGVIYCEDALSTAENADALVVLTEWNEFRALVPAELAQRMKNGVVIDLRNIFDPAAIRTAGLRYDSVGRL